MLQAYSHHFLIFARTILIYIIVLIVLRIMGKREVGQLSPFDLVVAIMIAELAAIPMEDLKIPVTHGIIPIITLMIAEVSFSYLCLKSDTARELINGIPNVLIANGKIIESEMKKCRYNISDLLSQLREQSVVNITDVEFAILETSGKLSVITKSQKRPVCPEDIKANTDYEGLPVVLISDGKLVYKNLQVNNLSSEWLTTQLKINGYDTIDDVFYASLDSAGNLFINPRIKRINDRNSNPY